MKKVRVVLLALLMALVVVGCQDAQQNDSAETQNNEKEIASTEVLENTLRSVESSLQMDTHETEIVSTSIPESNTEEGTSAGETPAEIASKKYETTLPTFDISHIISKLPEIPDWKSAESEMLYFSAKDSVPEEILREYEKRVLQKEIEIGKRLYLAYGEKTVSSIYYDKENDKYVMQDALFSKNGYLVTEQFDTWKRTLQKEVYSDTGKISDAKCFVDFPEDYTLLFISKRDNLSVVYDEKNSELVCLQYYQELGDRIPVSTEVIEDFKNMLEIERMFCLRVGYKNANNELVFPIILDNDGNISFHLVKSGKSETESYFSTAIKGDQDYWVCDDSIYCVENLEDSESIGYCDVGYVKASNIAIEEVQIDYSSLTDVEISQWDGWSTGISAVMGEYLLLGGYRANYSIWEMIGDAMFIEYFAGGNSQNEQTVEERVGVDIQETTFYRCPNWTEAEKVISESMRER